MSECELSTYTLAMMAGGMFAGVVSLFLVTNRLWRLLFVKSVDAMRPPIGLATFKNHEFTGTISDIADPKSFAGMPVEERLALREVCETILKNLDATATQP